VAVVNMAAIYLFPKRSNWNQIDYRLTVCRRQVARSVVLSLPCECLPVTLCFHW